MKRIGMAAAAGVLATGATAQAYTFDQVEIEYWAGSGDNEALTVLDFGDRSYAFGYRWDGEATSWDLLAAIDAAGGFGMTYTAYDFGNAIDSFSYGDAVIDSNWTETFAGFWGSTNGEDWETLEVGASDRVLSDGLWDGWSLEFISSETDFSPELAPDVPLVPEPASIALLTLGSVALMRRSRRTA